LELLVQLLWCAWVLQAAGCVYNVWTYGVFMARQDDAIDGLRPERRESVALIVAMKGATPETDAFLDALLTQDYPAYRIIFAVESEHDPALERLQRRLQIDGPMPRQPIVPTPGDAPYEVEVVVAGESVDTGQKVHNQIAAFRRLRDCDRLVAFADADLHCGPRWLSRLTGPLALGSHDLAGGYRWLIPESGSFTNLLASVINASVATLGGREVYNVLWGGSMALTREAFDALDVPELFSGSLNDDLHLAHTARRSGMRIGYVRSLLLPSTVRFRWRGFREFARRQYYQVRHYTPILYAISLVGTGVYTLSFVTSAAAAVAGYGLAWLPLLAVLGLDQLRALARRRLVRRVFDEETVRRLRATAVIEHLGTPIYMSLHLGVAAGALFLRRVHWAGVAYRVRGPRSIDVRRGPARGAPGGAGEPGGPRGGGRGSGPRA